MTHILLENEGDHLEETLECFNKGESKFYFENIDRTDLLLSRHTIAIK